MAASATRRGRPATKWQPAPPPTPKILHLPRRIKLHSKRHHPAPPSGRNLRSLFDEEEKAKSGADRQFELEMRYWKAEAEALRAECDSLRQERDAALRKLHKPQERKKIDGTDCIERKLEKLKVRSSGEANNVRETREIDECSKQKQEIINVEMLRRKMEGLSKGMIERLEEYGPFLLSGMQCRRMIGRGQEAAFQRQLKGAGAMSCGCCCKCKEVVLRIAEGVRAETGQWTELQEMLEQVRVEMDGLRSSRDLWQRRAVDSELTLRALRPDTATVRLPMIKCQQRCSPEKVKRVLVCRLNNPKGDLRRRSPLREIGNL